MKEKTWFDRWVDFEYERLNNHITTEIRQKLKIIKELGLENEIDKYSEDLEELHHFIIPNGCKAACFCHVCCTICIKKNIRSVQYVNCKNL